MTDGTVRSSDGPGPVEVIFDLGENGWGKVVLRIGDDSITLSWISYVTDVLGDLLRMALSVATGAWVSECSFDREPAEWRLVGRREHPGMLDVRVYEFDDAMKRSPISEGVEAFAGTCVAEDFASAIERAASEVLNRYQVEGYRAAWSYDFPSRAHAALTAALAIPASNSLGELVVGRKAPQQ